MQNALVDQASGMAAQTWDKEANRLAMMAGAQFDPANAARMQMEGEKLKMEAQSRALGSLMYPFGPSAANGGNGQVTNPGGGSGSPMNPANAGQAATSALMQGGAAGMQAAGQLLSQGIRFVNLPDGSIADLQAYQNVGGDNGDGSQFGYYPTDRAAGYMDDPNSQFYQGPAIPDYTNDGYPPIDPGFNIGDDYGYDVGGSNGDWDINPVTEDYGYDFDMSGGWE
jgi:hypothetical protein